MMLLHQHPVRCHGPTLTTSLRHVPLGFAPLTERLHSRIWSILPSGQPPAAATRRKRSHRSEQQPVSRELRSPALDPYQSSSSHADQRSALLWYRSRQRNLLRLNVLVPPRSHAPPMRHTTPTVSAAMQRPLGLSPNAVAAPPAGGAPNCAGPLRAATRQRAAWPRCRTAPCGTGHLSDVSPSWIFTSRSVIRACRKRRALAS